jgi:hypothetical protein
MDSAPKRGTTAYSTMFQSQLFYYSNLCNAYIWKNDVQYLERWTENKILADKNFYPRRNNLQ